MTSASTELRRAKAPRGLSKALLRLLMKRATVVANEHLSGHFRLVTLEGPALKGVAWTPGQKVQMAMGSAFVARTYTPIEWNAEAGRTCILGYAHGEGPGSAWLLGLECGDACDLFGPRASLDASRLPGPLAVFGDETSIGLAYALTRQNPAQPVACHFEVRDEQAAGKIASQLGLGDTALYAATAGDAHVADMEAALPALAAAGSSFVLTGKAGTVQRLRQELKRQAVPAGRIVAKAYWAPGKTGLD